MVCVCKLSSIAQEGRRVGGVCQEMDFRRGMVAVGNGKVKEYLRVLLEVLIDLTKNPLDHVCVPGQVLHMKHCRHGNTS